MGEVKEGIKMGTLDSVFWAPPHDGRFHSQQYQKYCWQSLVDYLKCVQIKGKNAEGSPCDYFKRSYHSLCHAVIREKFEDQLEKGTFVIRHKVAQMNMEDDE